MVATQYCFVDLRRGYGAERFGVGMSESGGSWALAFLLCLVKQTGNVSDLPNDAASSKQACYGVSLAGVDGKSRRQDTSAIEIWLVW